MRTRLAPWIALCVAVLTLSGCITDWRTPGPVTVTDVVLAPGGTATSGIRARNTGGTAGAQPVVGALSATALKTFPVAAGVAGEISVYFTSSIDYGSCQITLDGRRTVGGTQGAILPSGGRGFRIDVPTGALAPGRTARGVLSCEARTGMNPPETSEFLLTTVPMPVLRAEPKQITFPDTTVGQVSGPVRVTVTNRGLGELKIKSVVFETILGWEMTTTEFRATDNNCAGAALGPGRSCTLNVTHEPTTPGKLSAFMVFDSSAPNPDPERYPLYTTVLVLEANAPRTQVLSVNPAAKDFGEVMIGAGLEDTIVATNVSGETIMVLCQLDGDEAQFRVLNSACEDVVELAPGASMRVDVQFTPVAVGSQTAMLRFTPGRETAAEARVPVTGSGFTHAPPP